MLSLAVLRSGRAEYYLEVASGKEDYYLAGSESPGYWLGANAEALCLDGVVDGDDLRRLLEGIDPRSGEQLVGARTNRTPGFDLTFSAPKSVSILHALGSPDVCSAARAAHAEAVANTLAWLETHACAVRRGAGGARTEHGDGFVAAAFEHRTSRAGDPQLHTHVLVANVTRGPDGRWSAPDGRRLFALSKTAGYLYECELRHQLTTRLGVEFGTVHNGIADLRGIPRAVIDTFSQRRAQIIERLDELGLDSARAAQLATLATRDAKTVFDIDELRVSWNEIAAEHDITETALDDLTGRTQLRALSGLQVDTAFAVMAGDHGLTAQRSTFDRRHVIQEWCERHPQGAPIDRIEALTGHTLAHDEIIELDTPATATIRRSDGRTTAAPFGSRYSTRSLVALERQLLDLAHTTAGKNRGVVASEIVADAVSQRTLEPEQVAMVEALTRAGRGIEVVIAPAGAGKTYALGAANEAWTNAGYTVIGGALAARAARQLENEGNIPATTITKLTHDLRRGNLRLDPKTVLVIDEAAMAGTRTLAPLIDAAARRGSKVVLVGDTKQLAEIDAGGLVRALDHGLGGIRLTKNRRQHEPWEQATLHALRAGRAGIALDAYEANGRITTGTTARGLREQMGHDYAIAHLNGEHVIMLATRRTDVVHLNERARIELAARGAFHGPMLIIGGRDFRAGDRILCTKNRHRLGITNGTIGTVERVDVDARTIQMRADNGPRVVIPADYLEAAHVTHGYATTVHKAQGQTVDRCLVLADDHLTQEAGYTALSRGRVESRIYTIAPDNEHDHDHTMPKEWREELERALTTSTADRLATTYLHPEPEVEIDTDYGIEL